MAFVLTRWRNLGATDEERTARYPDDELVPEPADDVTRAIAIDAPASVVWRWLVQIGQGRGGMYSYDGVENLLGLDIHSADRIHEEWQDLAVGDRVVVVPPGKLGMKDGYSFPVVRVDHERCLVLRQCPPEHPWNANWTFVIEPTGPESCRLISRSRAARQPGWKGSAAHVGGLAMDPVTWVMTRKMLHGIRDRAEAEYRSGALARALQRPAEAS